jgi:voltage-gated potassium channel
MLAPGPPIVVRTTLRRRIWILGLYVRVLLLEFSWTLLGLAFFLALGGLAHRLTPQASLGGQHPSVSTSIFAGWMALYAQPQYSPPQPWYLMLIYSLYPIIGIFLVGEGIVRLALLMMSRRLGEKEWMQVLASTYRNHVILCGLGHLGFRVLEQLVASHTPVVAIEKFENNIFLAQAKAMHVPILIRDMKEDQALIDAGIERAAAVIVCSNDDIANLEVAIDSRRMNPNIRVVMRLFDQQLASKMSGALTIDAVFSASALAAPVVAALAFHTRVLSTILIGEEPYVIAQVDIEVESPLAGWSIADIESVYAARVLSRQLSEGTSQAPPDRSTLLSTGDVLLVHLASRQLPKLSAAAKRGGFAPQRNSEVGV